VVVGVAADPTPSSINTSPPCSSSISATKQFVISSLCIITGATTSSFTL